MIGVGHVQKYQAREILARAPLQPSTILTYWYHRSGVYISRSEPNIRVRYVMAARSLEQVLKNIKG